VWGGRMVALTEAGAPGGEPYSVSL
jgi:hypothetical protein